jgi:hypothetical protein
MNDRATDSERLMNTWWMLAVAFAVHVIVTAGLGFVTFEALDGGTVTLTRGARPSLTKNGEPRRRIGAGAALRPHHQAR